jgi:membrane protease subunit HflK
MIDIDAPVKPADGAEAVPAGGTADARWLRWTSERRRSVAGVLAVALLAAYLASGFYLVDADEHAVVRRFGAVAARVGPGMHYRLPWPVDKVDVLKTTAVVKMGAGFALPQGEAEAMTGVELLTGDTNLINIALVVQYVIGNPADFLFEVQAPQELVGALAQSVLTETVVGMPVDEVLTTGRLAIQTRVQVRTQELLDRYRSGIHITYANIMSITLDSSVAQAFQDVADAMSDREKLQNQAHAYANDQIPKARGEAYRLVSDAENYKQQRMAEAAGEANRFLALLEEYRKAPEITRSRLYLDAMSRTLPKVKMYVIDSQGGRVPVNLRVSAP